MRVFRLRSMALILAVGLVTPLCVPPAATAQDDGATEPGAADAPDPASAQKMALVRFLDASHADSMDFYVDDAPMVVGLSGEDISGYMEVPAGKRRFSLVATDPPSTDEATIKLKPGSRTTIAGTPGNNDSSVSVIRAIKDKPKPVVGSSRLRIVNLCSNCGGVDVLRDGKKKQRMAKGLPYGKATKDLKMAPGQLDLRVKPGDGNQRTWDLEPIELENSTAGTLFLTRWIIDETFKPVYVTDAGASTLMALNPAREGVPVDVYVDGALAAQKMGAGSMRKPVKLASGEHLVQVVESGTDPTDGVLAEGSLELEPGPHAMIVGVGSTLEATPAVTARAAGADTPRIRFVHADAETPTLDIELRDLDPVLDLAFGESTDYLTLADQSSYAWLRPADGSGGMLHEMPLDLGPGNYTAYIGGTAEPPTIDMVIVRDEVAGAKKRT